MEKTIVGEEKFQVLANSFSIGPAREETYLMYSADGRNYTKWEDKIPANENLVVNGISNGMWFYMKNNKTNRILKW